MGATPRFALNIVGFPIKKLSNEILSEILKGGADKAKEAGISILGGHSIDDEEPKYGLVVTGEVEESKLVRNSTAHENDAIVLTKPLGTGIISTAIKQDKVSNSIIDQAIDSMKYLNAFSSSIMHEFDTHAATDISGFGLLGHLYEMCSGSNLSAEISFDKIPFLKGVNKLANDIITIYHNTDAGRRNITGSLAPHNILSASEEKLLSDIKVQMNQRWNSQDDPELRQSLRNYIKQQGLLYFVYYMLDTNPEHPFVIELTEY